MKWLLVAMVFVLFPACDRSGEPKRTVDDRFVEAMNEGVGLLGRFDFKDAEDAFARALEIDPDSLDAALDKAIARLNRTDADAQKEALAQLDAILERDPRNVRANYCAGLALLYMGRPVEALPCLQFVVSEHPKGAYASYFLAQALEQTGSLEQAMEAYRRAIELDPFLRSSWLGLQRTYARLGFSDKAAEALAEFERLASSPKSRLAEFRYSRMGPLAMGTLASLDSVSLEGGSAKTAFAAPVLLVEAPSDAKPRRSASIQAVDLDGDGLVDVVVSGWNEDGSSLVYLRTDGGYELDADHPLSRVSEVTSMLFGDVDADGHVDAFLCRDGDDQLLLQQADHSWRPFPGSFGSDGRDLKTVDGALADLDHDGDLDIFCVHANGPNALFNNNGDGTFRDIAAEAGVAGESLASRQVMVADLDLDRDADLVILNDEPPNEVLLNDRLWSYARSKAFEKFEAAPLDAVVAWYSTLDGRAEIRARLSSGGLETWREGPGGAWLASDAVELDDAQPGEPIALELADVTGDARLELLVLRTNGFEIRDGRNRLLASSELMPANVESVSSMSTLLESTTRGPGVLLLSPEQGLVHFPPSTTRGGFATVSFSGRDDPAQQMRSNASGIGTRWAARIGTTWQAGATWRTGSGPGQGLQPTAIGMGQASTIDFIEIDWPDGVFQTELALRAGGPHLLTETQRQISSCPLVFVRGADEESFEFLTDVLGVGGLGYLVEPGVTSQPRPREALLLRRQPAEIRLAEPMEEACYLDAVRLVGIDAPAGYEIVLDERMGIEGDPPSSTAIAVADVRFPIAARTDRDEDVLAAVREHDLLAPDPGEVDPRYLGRLAGEYMLELEFDSSIDACDILLVEGWVEYPYSQTNFAAWQAGASFDAPTLEARTEAGEWVSVADRFGYPAGMPRAMSLPIDHLPDRCTAIRLRTNQEIYWDRVRLAKQSEVPITRIEVSLLEAAVAVCGFPVRSTGPQRQPKYDYGRRSPFGDVRHQAGFYTAIGECGPLLARTDDACAIIGPGEEIRLRFESAPPPREGDTRHWVLELDGWCKDMDLFTRDGERIEPLPARQGEGPPDEALELMHRFNTRFASGR